MRKKAIILIVLTIILLLVIVIIGVVCYSYKDTTPQLYKPFKKIEFFSKWQSYIKDEAKINEIVTPGSHDAGCNNMMPLARTQGHDIYDQLVGGVRYFDLRVTEKGDDLVISHSIIKGTKFQKVLNDFNRFFKENPTEFVVMDFQKIGNNLDEKVIDFLCANLDMSKAMIKSKFHSIESTTIGQLRNNGINFIIIWKNQDYTTDNDFLYLRKDNLNSFYDRKFHKNPNGNELIKHFDEYYNKYGGNGFFVLQSQRTATKIIDKPSEMELAWGETFNNFVKNLNSDKEKLYKTNIIMRDFIVSDMDKVKIILNLNLTKNLVKDDLINEYKYYVKID